MKLQSLHEEFIDKARRPMTFGRIPIKPVEGDIAIVATEKWKKVESPTRLRKTYRFRTQQQRNRFVSELFEYEEETKHNATITVEEGQVTLDVRTKDLDQVTEIDKEYAKFADILFKDVVYNSANE